MLLTATVLRANTNAKIRTSRKHVIAYSLVSPDYRAPRLSHQERRITCITKITPSLVAHRERGGWGEVSRTNTLSISDRMSLTPTTEEREMTAKTRQNAADVFMSDVFREHAGGEQTASRAGSYGYKKVSNKGASLYVFIYFFFSFFSRKIMNIRSTKSRQRMLRCAVCGNGSLFRRACR